MPPNAASVRTTVRVGIPEVQGVNEWMLGVRHEKHGKGWYHCEQWIRRVLRD